MTSFSSDSFSTDSFDTDSFLFDVLTGVVVQGGGSSAPNQKVETKRRTHPKEMPKAEQDYQDFIDISVAIVQFLNSPH